MAELVGHQFCQCICVQEAVKHDCLDASSGNPVVQTEARVSAAGLISVLSFCMYIIFTVLHMLFKCFCNSSRSSFGAALFMRVN